MIDRQTLKEVIKESIIEIEVEKTSTENLKTLKEILTSTIIADCNGHLAFKINETTSEKELLSVYAQIMGYK